MTNSLDLIKVGGACVAALAQKGCEVETITDFRQAEALTEQMGKASQTAKLSSEHNDFTEESGFWLFMKEHGHYVTAVATRFDDVGRESMADYMIRTMRRHYPHESGETLLNFTDALPEGFHGRMAYIGELFVHPGHRGSRQKLRYFMLLLQTCIATKWKVDWTYAMMRDRDVQRGFAATYGFTGQLPGVAQWAEPAPEGRGDAEWLVSVPARQRDHMMHYFAGSLESL